MEKTTLLKITTTLGVAGIAGLALQGLAGESSSHMAQFLRAMAIVGVGISLALTPQAVLNATASDQDEDARDSRGKLELVAKLPLLIILCLVVVMLTINTAKPLGIMATILASAGAGIYLLATPFLYPDNVVRRHDANRDDRVAWSIMGGMTIQPLGAFALIFIVGTGRDDWSVAGETWAFITILIAIAYQAAFLPAMTLKWVWEREDNPLPPPQAQAATESSPEPTREGLPAGNGVFSPLRPEAPKGQARQTTGETTATPAAADPTPGEPGETPGQQEPADPTFDPGTKPAGRYDVRITETGTEFRERPEPQDPAEEPVQAEENGNPTPPEEGEKPSQADEGTMIDEGPEPDGVAAPY